MSILTKFPSFGFVVKYAISTFARFPFVLLSAGVGTFCVIAITEDASFADKYFLERLTLTVSLGLPLFVTLAVFSEKLKWSYAGKIAFQSIGAILLAAYFLSLPEKIGDSQATILRYAMLSVGLHALVAFSPFWKKGEEVGFWQYNKALFVRFLTAALFSGVLFVGLAIALASAEHLFGINVDGDRYFELWLLMAGLFHPWIFLAGVPEGYWALNATLEYPKGLKVFAQYILLPLVALYLVILYAYEAKIIIEWNWPKGWVSELVLWYSVVGILSLLLLHPLRDKSGNLWITVFSKWFFRVLIPLVAMLFLAILRRISDYGVTELRYVVFGLAVGLMILILYFELSKRKNIRVVPIVLCALAFFSAFGPWGASSVSFNSQKDRFDALLAETGLLVDGQLTKTKTEIPREKVRELSGLVKYIVDWHGVSAFKSWLPDSAFAHLDTLSSDPGFRVALDFGFDYLYFQRQHTGDYFYLGFEISEARDIEGYQFLKEISYSMHSERANSEFTIDGQAWVTIYDTANGQLIVTPIDPQGDSAKIEIVEYLITHNELMAGKKLKEPIVLTAVASAYEVKLYLNNASGYDRGQSIELNDLYADLLIKLRTKDSTDINQ